MQSYKTDIFRNAYILCDLLGVHTISKCRLNLSATINNLLKTLFQNVNISHDPKPNGIGLILAGRIKPISIFDIQTRSYSSGYNLCVSSITGKLVLDIGLAISLSSKGLIGVKVGTIH